MADSCILWPKVKDTNKPSNLYKGLANNPNLKGDRNTVNYIYAAYLQPGVAEKMDSLGYKRDSLGEHSPQDVYKFFEVSKILHERVNKTTQERLAGAKDTMGNVIIYSDGKEVLDKVNDYNSNSKGFVAFAYKNGNDYSISIVDRNSQTVYKNRSMEKAKKNFEYLKAVFNKYGVDFENLLKSFPSLFDVTNMINSLSWMESLAKTKNILLMQGDINFLLNFGN